MSTAVNDIILFRGEDVIVTFSMSPAESIAGWTIVMSIKQSFADTSALTTINGAITNSATGVFTVTIPNSFTNRAPGRYVYDVQRTDSGQVAVLSTGNLYIQKEVRL